MFKILKYFVLLVITSSSLLCFSPKDSASFDISNYSIVGDPRVGDTIQFVINFDTSLGDSADVVLNFTDLVTPLSYDTNYRYIKQRVAVDSTSSNQLSFDLKVQGTGNSDLSIILINPTQTESEMGYSQRKVHLETDPDYGTVYPWHAAIRWKNEQYSLFGTTNFNISIDGKVTYPDWYSPYEPGEVVEKGAFNQVRLWLRYTDFSERNNYYLLKPLNTDDPLNPKYIEGVHYANCDDEGNYSFNLTNVPLPTTEEFELFVTVALENDIIRFTSACEMLYKDSINMLSSAVDYIYTYTSKSQKRALNVDINETNQVFEDVDISIPSREGSIFRWTGIAQNLILERFNVTKTEDLDFPWYRIDIDIPNRKDVWYSGRYHPSYSNNNIELTDQRPLLITHEYGHYIDEMWGNNPGNCSNLTEGIADFLCGATAAYANNKYGDEPYVKNNWEMGPYFYVTKVLKPNDIKFNNTRFGNIRPENQDLSRFVCYIGNAYDSYRDDPFLQKQYLDQNNDDINGLGDIVFQFLYDKFNQINGYTGVNSDFTSYIDPYSQKPELTAALDGLWDFLDGTSAKTAPAQIDNLECNLDNVNDTPGYITLTWDSRSFDDASYTNIYDDKIWYLNEFAFYDNTETGFKIYYREDITDPWSLLATKTNSEFSHEIPCGLSPDPCVDEIWYKVTAYNSGGESMDAPEFGLDGGSLQGGPISVEDKNYINIFNISPNPSSDLISIEYNLLNTGNVKIEIFNENFNKVKSLDIGNISNGIQSTKINIEDLSSGVYFIKLITISNKNEINIKSNKFVVVK
jgi:hypothetical protein